MAAGVYNFVIEQGAQFERTFQWKDAKHIPIPMTGYVAQMHLREQANSALMVADWSRYLGINEPEGILTLIVPAPQTEIIQARVGVYDIELIPPTGAAYKTRFLKGTWQLTREVTK
jgi:hypothetical protein